MYNWVPFPFLRIAFFFILGIIGYAFTGLRIPDEQLFLIVTLSFGGYLALIFLLRKNRFIQFNLLLSLLFCWMAMLLGHAMTWHNTPSNNALHIINEPLQIEAYTGMITKQPVVKEKSTRLEVEIAAIKTQKGWSPSEGKLFVYVRNDSASLAVEYGDQLLITGAPSKLEGPKNPNEFNYREYIGFQGIYYNHFIKQTDYKIISEGNGSNLIAYSIAARKWCEGVINKHITTPREKAIALALIIGVKEELDKDISEAYASAGAMHVLAVSGLHVGIIYLILSFLLRKFKSKKYGRWAYFTIVLVGLWSYAFITGLSASVLRAVTMFSFVTLAEVTGKQSNIYNTLAVSAMVLLCYNPYLIMAVGFQLSFLAVFGIVYMQPKIYKLIYVQNNMLDKIWGITAVSIAAQIATAPLVVLYFHQLPSYFFISNLFVIPGALIILCGGLLLFAISGVPFINEVVGTMLKYTIWIVNEAVFSIRLIPYNTMDNIYLTTFQSWCIILVIMFLLALFHFRKLIWMALLLVPVVGFSYSSFNNASANIENDEIVFYAVNNAIAIDFIEGESAFLLADSALRSNHEKLKFHIAPYRLKRGIPIDYDNVNDTNNPIAIKRMEGWQLIVWKGKTIAIIEADFKTNFQSKARVDMVYLPKLYKKLYQRVTDNFMYNKLIIKPYKELPEYVNHDNRIHDLTVKGAYHFKL